MDSAEAAIQRLCDPAAEVSAHYLIDRFGFVTRFVDEDRRAWHAGSGEWRGQQDINSRSIGIELDNRGDCPYSEPQMSALEKLLADICTRWDILPENVIGHSDMAPGRKIDPGGRFDWARLQRLNLAAFPMPLPTPSLFRDNFDIEECQSLLWQIGYTAEAPLGDKLQAFRDRFLPVSSGAPNGADRAVMLQFLNGFGTHSLCQETPAAGS